MSGGRRVGFPVGCVLRETGPRSGQDESRFRAGRLIICSLFLPLAFAFLEGS